MLFVVTVWLILAVSDDGLPGGAKVAVVEVAGRHRVGGDRGLDTEAIVRTLGEYRDDPAVHGGGAAHRQPGRRGRADPGDLHAAVRRLREAEEAGGRLAGLGGRLRRLLRRGLRRSHLREPRHAHRLDRRRDAARQRGGPAQEGRRGVRGGQGGRLQGCGQLRARDDSGGAADPPVAPRRRLRPVHHRGRGRPRPRESARCAGSRRDGSTRVARRTGSRWWTIWAGSRTPSRPPRRWRACRRKPKVLYPRRRFSFRELLRNEWGLGPVSSMLPAMQTLRTPLYLMP